MPKKTFTKETLLALLWDDGAPENLEVVSDAQYDSSRWSSHHMLIFAEKDTDTYYSIHYSRGLTECQDEMPFEYEPENIECTQVEPYEKKTIMYRPVKD